MAQAESITTHSEKEKAITTETARIYSEFDKQHKELLTSLNIGTELHQPQREEFK